ncbi:MAG: GntR family transcriptional regulator [Lachnospiraceae bacterium]
MIAIDVQSRKPIYEQIVERFETLIVSGVLAPDSQLPSVRALAMELSINPNTIQKAYTMLEQEGFIYPVRGRGNFVSGDETLKKKKQERVYCSLQELVRRGKTLEIPQEDVHQPGAGIL